MRKYLYVIVTDDNIVTRTFNTMDELKNDLRNRLIDEDAEVHLYEKLLAPYKERNKEPLKLVV